MKTTLISKIYRTIQAKNNCLKLNNMEWFVNHNQYLNGIEKKYLPCGSGIDRGCIISDKSKEDKIIIVVPYHLMDENGFYCGWMDYTITCKPSFDGPELKITCPGKDKFMIKDYLYDLFYECLNKKIEFQPIIS
jgi:hypothetical protein